MPNALQFLTSTHHSEDEWPKPDESVSQVTWIRTAALGDCLIATAALEQTCRRFPSAKVVVVGPQFWVELLDPEAWPKISGILVLDKNSHYSGHLWTPDGSDWKKQNASTTLFDVLRVSQAAVNLRIESFRYLWPLLLCRVPIRIGTGEWWMRFFYTHWAPWLGKDPVLHERDWQLWVTDAKRSTGKFLSIEEARHSFGADPSPSVRHWKERGGLPRLRLDDQKRAARFQLNKPYILINPTSSRREKAWPAERFKDLCNRLRAENNFSVYILGGPSETEWLNEVSSEGVLQPSSLADALGIIAQAKLLITNTSSLQFLAATCETPVLTLMGRANPKIWGPIGKHDQFLSGRQLEKNAPFRSDEDDIFEDEKQKYAVIQVDDVLKALASMVDAAL